MTEKDFFQAQKLAIKKSPVLLVRLTQTVLPLAGLAGLIFLSTAVAREGFKINMIGGVVFPLWFLSIPLLTRRTQKKLYRKTKHFHGPMSLETGDYGMTIKGDGIDSRMAWSNFVSFHEDDNCFVIYSSNSVFHPIPKRMLLAEQIAGLRECFESNIRAKG
ncbi:MAG TPA: YcxB family protein [Candidatus Angelobacter sp.]|nr:YcxB family protein [Candidatus Angelobacter sp.]